MNETPRANRTHIAILGKTNAGKSSFINALTGQNTSLVSDIKGTTTDPVYKSMEINGLGACVLIDTAGFDDDSILGKQRIDASKKILDKTDIAIMLFTDTNIEKEKEWFYLLKKKNIPIISVINKIDIIDYSELAKLIKSELNTECTLVSSTQILGIDEVLNKLSTYYKIADETSITGHLINKEDVVLLVMPQDIQAPKGRLILPQVQTIRDLLDNKCIVISSTADNVELALDCLKKAPKLIITDSQVFDKVKKIKPSESELTSFSVLFAKYKGDIETFINGAKALANLKPGDKVLIAEACTHNPLDGDIAREKLPKLLRKNYGEVDIEVVSGNNFPEDLSFYSVIIHCGSCMFNRKYVLARIEKAKESGIPITNYGLSIAFMNNMFDSITY